MTEITLDRILGAAAKRQVALTSETAGYFVLAVADALAGDGGKVAVGDLRLDSEGRVLVGQLTPCSSESKDDFLRSILKAALDVAVCLRPALVRLATQPPCRTNVRPRGFGRELETALIPVNRAAARRALARLHREVTRAGELPHEASHGVPHAQLSREHPSAELAGVVQRETNAKRTNAAPQRSVGLQPARSIDRHCGESSAMPLSGPISSSTSSGARSVPSSFTHYAEATTVVEPGRASLEQPKEGNDGSEAAEQPEQTLALPNVRRSGGMLPVEALTAPLRIVADPGALPQVMARTTDEFESAPRYIPLIELAAALPVLLTSKAADGDPDRAHERTLALPLATRSTPAPEPLPALVGTVQSLALPSQLAMTQALPVIDALERTLALPISLPPERRPATEKTCEPCAHVQLPSAAPLRPLFVEPIEQTSALPCLVRSAEPAPADANPWPAVPVAAIASELAQRSPSSLDSIERTMRLPLLITPLEPSASAMVGSGSDPGRQEPTLDAASLDDSMRGACIEPLGDVEREVEPSPGVWRDSGAAPRAKVGSCAVGPSPTQEGESLAPLEVTMALPLVRRRVGASPRMQRSESSDWEQTSVDAVVEIEDHEIYYVEPLMDLYVEEGGEFETEWVEGQATTVSVAGLARTASVKSEPHQVLCAAEPRGTSGGLQPDRLEAIGPCHDSDEPAAEEKPAAGGPTHYGSHDGALLTTYSSIETLSCQFVTETLWSEAELSRRLRVAAGVETAEGLSRTPPPVATRSIEVQSPAQLEPTRKLRRVGAATTAGAAVAVALCLCGKVHHGASAFAASSPGSDALARICRGTVNVRGVEPEHRLQIRQTGENRFREPTWIVGTTATFLGLTCGKDAELLVDDDRDGLSRIPIPGMRLQPLESRPWVVADLKLDGAP